MTSVRNHGVLFLCVHNAGRSQMAAGFARHLARGFVAVFSGGSEPGPELNRLAVEVMAEVGVDISSQLPTRFTLEMIDAVDVVVTMGCGDTCPLIPGKKYLDWPLEDPAGKSLEEVRLIRDEIRLLVTDLISGLVNPST